MGEKHTQEPWIVEESDFDDSILITTDERKGAFVPIASVSTGYTGPIEDEQQANILLMAAAPVMLSTLQGAWSAMEDIIERGHANELFYERQAKVASAIAKATGAPDAQ